MSRFPSSTATPSRPHRRRSSPSRENGHGSIRQKVAIVTGGGSGIGRATALSFAREGAKVAIADNNVDSGQETAELIHERRGEALFAETDVSADSSVVPFVRQTIDRFGLLGCAANIAGVTQPATPLAETPVENFRFWHTCPVPGSSSARQGTV